MTRHEDIVRMMEEMNMTRYSNSFEKLIEMLEPLHKTLIRRDSLQHHEVLSSRSMEFTVEEVVMSRDGAVLSPQMILKFDHFPGCQKLSLLERIEGAPNYRFIENDDSMGIYGVAMPCATAIPVIVQKMQANKAQHIQWICLREEPVIFVKGKPFVLRHVFNAVVNIETTGITSERVEYMENLLKADIEKELSKYGDRLLMHEEVDGRLVGVWEHVIAEQVKTVRQVFEESACNMAYHRIPVTDEQSPIPRIFDDLLRIIKSTPPRTHFMFNCQMGRGRTTTGMAIAFIMHLCSLNNPSQATPAKRKKSKVAASEADQKFLDGEYRIVMLLMQLVEQGRTAKRIVDHALDSLSQVQNLREAIYDYRQSVVGRERGVNYLVRYFYLIAFTAYLLTNKQNESFEGWMKERPEISGLVPSAEMN